MPIVAKVITTLAAVLLIAGGFAWSEAGANTCAPHDRTVEMLADTHGERVIGEGVSRGRMVELFRSEAGSWTLLVTFPTGLSCIVAAGEAWEEFAFSAPIGEGA